MAGGSLHFFFYILGNDLLRMVEHSISKGYVFRELNLTFITLIHKCEKPESFADYHPISLCNLAYKIITQILSNRIKPKLAESIPFDNLVSLVTNRFWMQWESPKNVYIPLNSSICIPLSSWWIWLNITINLIGISRGCCFYILGCLWESPTESWVYYTCIFCGPNQLDPD